MSATAMSRAWSRSATTSFLGVVIQSLAEVTVLAEKGGVPRHAFLDFINNSVMGSVFSRYKSPALVNLDFTPTFTPVLLKKDLDLGLDAAEHTGASMPLTAIARELVQSLIARGHVNDDFATMILQQAEASGLKLAGERPSMTGCIDTRPPGRLIASAAKQSRLRARVWIASSLRSSQ